MIKIKRENIGVGGYVYSYELETGVYLDEENWNGEYFAEKSGSYMPVFSAEDENGNCCILGFERLPTFKELRESSGMNKTQYAAYFKIPYRTIQNWESGVNKCPEYLLSLMQYKLDKEKAGE